MTELWECYKCALDFSVDYAVGGYLKNYQPICENCADHILAKHGEYPYTQLTFHYLFGDLQTLQGYLYIKPNNN